ELYACFFFSSRRRHTRSKRDWSSDVCSSDLQAFKTIFTSYAKTNQPLVYLAFSSELSGTYQTAKIMEQEVKEECPDAPLHVIDRSEERRVGKECRERDMKDL